MLSIASAAVDRRLADEVRQFGRRLEMTLAEGHRRVDGMDRITGTDPTGTVTGVVDVRGDFVDLSIGSGWWETTGPGGIGTAVLDALRAARFKAVLAGALLRRHGRPVPARRSADPPEQAPPGFPDIAAEWAAARATVDRGYRLLRAVDRIAELRDSPRPRTISGPAGLFSLEVTGFTITDASVSAIGLSPSDGELLAADAEAALREATGEQDPGHWLTTEAGR